MTLRSERSRCAHPIRLPVKHLHVSPTFDAKGAAHIFVATDIEPRIVLGSGAVLTNVRFSSDLDGGAEFDRARTGNHIIAAANVCPRCGDARRIVSLSRDRI